MNDYYSVSAVITHKTTDKKGYAWVKTVQVPTFFLDVHVQGITSDTHAEKIAREVIMPVPNKDMTVSICVMRHKQAPSDQQIFDKVFPTEVA